MRNSLPVLEFSADLAIGYASPLARTTSGISLGAGTHFLLGRNGRGKTTLLRTIADSLRPLAGSLKKSGTVRFLPENLGFDPYLNAVDILRSLAAPGRLAASLKLAREVELDLEKPYGRLSTGNRRKLHLLVAEFSTPEDQAALLLLDEPFSGLDAHAREAFETHWLASSPSILRVVSCHPDYDAMPMASALVIRDQTLCHQTAGTQTWSDLKALLN
ncbi:MAG: ATP-binding cassette domain-containing protein [Akkermansiaceae bacterium]|jgi:ATPase subunit of ABC transporter with duplicated ATPase domains|nr:ATP-binding cassette domain-containing protein [Akkermansiaceae bacterium]